MSIWKKYCEKKIKEFKESDEYKNIQEVLEEMHPNRWEINLIYPEDADFNDVRVFWSERRYYSSDLETYKSLFNYGNKFNSIKQNIKLEVIIHHPEITIKNRNGLKHQIRDLYTKLSFPILNLNSIVKLKGVRSTISKPEYDARYAHSHLPRGSFFNFETFCVGSSEFGCSLSSEFITTDRNKLMGFLLLLQAYLEYESIEGVPYVRMENCQNVEDLSTLRIYTNDFLDLIKEKPPISINKNFKITNREEIELWLGEKSKYVATKINNKYYNIIDKSELESLEEIQDRKIFIFKNQTIKLKIDNYATTTEPKKYCHPKYSTAVIKYWENRIFQTYLRNNRIKSNSTCNNATECLEPSEVLVSEDMGS